MYVSEQQSTLCYCLWQKCMHLTVQMEWWSQTLW